MNILKHPTKTFSARNTCIKKQINKVTGPVYVAPTWHLNHSSDRNQQTHTTKWPYLTKWLASFHKILQKLLLHRRNHDFCPYHRQGSAVLMASDVLVLKHETSTLRQSHNFISNDFKFGVGDNVMEVTSPTKVGSDLISGQDAKWGQHIWVL